MQTTFPPRCAGRYRPIRLLGAGGFGTVFLARQIGLDRPVAIKLLRHRADDDPNRAARFFDEARLTALLKSEHIVRVLDFDAEDGMPWIVYEYLPGTCLRETIRGGPIPWRRALSIVGQMATAVVEAHARGILHRDIKPDNILQAEPDLYKLADFGLAWTRCDRTAQTGSGVVLGTLGYLAPEVMRGAPPAAAADIFSLGAVLSELISGEPASSGRCADVPPRVDRIVKTARAEDPARRHASAAELLEDVRKCLAMRVTRATPTRTLVLPRRQAYDAARGRRRIAAGALAAVLACVIAGASSSESSVAAASGVTARVTDELPRLEELLHTAERSLDVSRARVGQMRVHLNPMALDLARVDALARGVLHGSEEERALLARITSRLESEGSGPARGAGLALRARASVRRFESWSLCEIARGARAAIAGKSVPSLEPVPDADLLFRFVEPPRSHEGTRLLIAASIAQAEMLRCAARAEGDAGDTIVAGLRGMRDLGRHAGMQSSTAAQERQIEEVMTRCVAMIEAGSCGREYALGRLGAVAFRLGSRRAGVRRAARHELELALDDPALGRVAALLALALRPELPAPAGAGSR